MFCTKCGVQLLASGNFCHICGAVAIRSSDAKKTDRASQSETLALEENNATYKWTDPFTGETHDVLRARASSDDTPPDTRPLTKERVAELQLDYENARAAAARRRERGSTNSVSQQTRFHSLAIWLKSIVKSKWMAAIVCGVLLIVLIGALVVFFFRYDVKPRENSLVVIRLDRLTGEILWCAPQAGCFSHAP